MVLRSFVALVVATASVAACHRSPSSSDPPRTSPSREAAGGVHFEPRIRDVEGLVEENVAVSFDLLNSSDHAVRLAKADGKWGDLRVDTPTGESIPACKLSGELASPLTIAPGARVTLVDAFDGDLACEPGSREECWVRAWIDDASTPIEATIRWRRHPLQAVHGDVGDLGEIEPRGTIERRFTIESAELGRFEVNHAGVSTEVQWDPLVIAALDVKGRDVTPPGAVRTTYEVVVRIDAAKLPYGDRWIQIVASLPRSRVRRVPINLRWNLAPPFELLLDGRPVADSLSLGLVKAGDALLHRVALHSRDPAHAVRVRGARVETRPDGPRFGVAIGPFVDGDTALALSLAETPNGRSLSGELVVETDDPRAPVWRKRLSGIWNGVAAPPAGK